jgi:hypothetical protein
MFKKITSILSQSSGFLTNTGSSPVVGESSPRLPARSECGEPANSLRRPRAPTQDTGVKPRSSVPSVSRHRATLMSHAREERLSCLEWSKKEAHATDLQALDRFIANRFDHECGSGVDISRLNDFLIRISDFFSALELVSARSLHFEKYAAKKKIFTMAIEKTKGRSLDVVGPYRETRFFRDQNRLLIDLARDRMLNSVMRHFDLPENAVGEIVKRITRKDLAAVSQAEYVIHVTHLFNL